MQNRVWLVALGVIGALAIGMLGLFVHHERQKLQRIEQAAMRERIETQRLREEEANRRAIEAKQEEERQAILAKQKEEQRQVALLRGRLNAGVFRNALSKVADASKLVSAADVNPAVPRELKVVVTAQWFYQPEAVRKELATSLWSLWARIEEPERPDSARISIVTPSGKEVGGSRVWAGSLIWVE